MLLMSNLNIRWDENARDGRGQLIIGLVDNGDSIMGCRIEAPIWNAGGGRDGLGIGYGCASREEAVVVLTSEA